MDSFIITVQFIIYLFSAKVLSNIWKNNKAIVVNRKSNIFIVVISSILCVSLNLLINTGLPLVNEWFASSKTITDTNMLELVIVSIMSVVIAPLLEEVFFRYYLYEKIKIRTTTILSLIISSIIFGIVHFYGIAGLIATVCLGIIFQLVYIKTMNLANTILIHAICNLLIIIIGLISISVNQITLFVFVTSFLVSSIIFFIKIRVK